MTKASRFLDRLIALCIYGVVGVVPLFFLPVTAEAVEFNKQFLLYFLVILGIIAWVIKGIITKKLVIRRTPLDIPLLLIIATMLIASIASKNRYLSFWGDFGMLGDSFVSFIFYILFYFLVLNNVESVKKVVRIIIVLAVSGVLSSLYFIGQSLGILPLSGLPVPRWTASSDLPTHFGYYITVVMILVLSLVMAKMRGFFNKKNIFGLIAVLIFLAALVVLGFKSVWLIVAVSIFLLLVFALSRIEEVEVPWVSLSFGILVISILFIILGSPAFLTANLPTEVSLSPGVSWNVTTSALSENLKNFLFGSGPATFVYDFSAFRPEAFNSNFAWSLRFNRPYSAIIGILSTNGLLGTIAWISLFLVALGTFFVMWFVKNIKIKKKTIDKLSDLIHLGDGDGDAFAHTLYAGLMTGWLTLLISMFFITFTTVHWVLFFLCLALTFLLGMDFSKKESNTFTLSLKTLPQYTLISSFIYILVFALIIVLVIFLGRFYAGEVYKAQAIKYTTVGNHTQAATVMFKAVSLNPSYSKYYLDLASAYIGMAVVASQNETPDPQRIANLVASAVNQAREATRLSPNDAASWDFLATMYATARPLSQNANSFAISALEQAIKLEKTNPRLYLDLGRAKVLQKDYSGAREALEKAVTLKPDYVLGYNVIAQLDEIEGKENEAIEHMSVAAALSPNDPVLIYNLGRLYYNRAKQDDLVRAEQLFLRAAALNENYADALWSLGVLYERQGKTSQALQLYRRVETLNPGNQDVKQKIQRLIGA
ncbi:tetratricopeptide repeat protein [Candidatus Parcubacteria bacterium]|nr:tetratricopeptide repeat protein [Patescibacteria group bacterium]MCG2693685.1 tetratricopeptide repeat protein [Candidatus Parcubacteria bacterium]